MVLCISSVWLMPLSKGEKEWQKMAELPEGAVPICGLAVGHAAEPLDERQIQPVFATNFVK